MSENKRAKVNHKAVDTWLEPYIGELVDVIQIKGDIITFQFEGETKTHADNLAFFELINP